MMTSGSSALASAAISSTLPLPSRVAGTGRASGAISAHDHIQTDGRGQADRFGQARFGIAQRRIGARAVLGLDMDDEGAGLPNDQADFVRGFVLQLDRAHRHHGRDRVLVDQLGLAVPAQQHAEIVEPSDVALKLYAVDQKDGDRRCSCGPH